MQQEAGAAATSNAPTADYRSLLEEEREQLVAKLSEIGYSTTGALAPDGPSYDHNFADSSQVTAERGEAEALASKLRETLDEVERALAKLDEGTYGICEGCGSSINPSRLEAMPAARFCISCAAKGR